MHSSNLSPTTPFSQARGPAAEVHGSDLDHPARSHPSFRARAEIPPPTEARKSPISRIRHQAGIRSESPLPLHLRRTANTPLKPTPRHNTRRTVLFGSIDFGQRSDDLEIRPKASQCFDEGPKALGARIEHTIGAERVVPPVAKGANRSSARPIRPGPRVRPPPKTIYRPVGLNGRDSGTHPPTRNARSAAMTTGPTSSRSPSRISRAGERSSSCGFKP